MITGSEGLVGSSIINEIPKKKYKIFKIDNKISNLHSIEKKSFVKVLDKVNPDIVVHCAAHPGGLSMKEPIKNINVNLLGSFRIIEWCSKNNSKLIFLSSSAVYGDQKIKKLKENSNLSPGTVYGINKVACESYIKELSKYKKFKWLIIRLFATYGANHKPNVYQGIINVVLTQLSLKRNLIIKGSLLRERDLIHSKDAGKIIIKLINKNINNKIINVGTGKSTQINKIIKICMKFLHTNNRKVIVENSTPGDPMYAVANISLLKNILIIIILHKLKKVLKKLSYKLKKNEINFFNVRNELMGKYFTHYL